MNNPMITDALLDGRSIIVVGHAPLDSKVTAFQSLVDALADERKLGVIDEHHVLPTVPPPRSSRSSTPWRTSASSA